MHLRMPKPLDFGIADAVGTTLVLIGGPGEHEEDTA
jgi:hypothetical protein